MAKEQVSPKQTAQAAILEGLRGVREDHPVWKSVLALVDYQAGIADQRTIEEGISPNQRTHYAGQEKGIKTVRSALLIMHAQANKN